MAARQPSAGADSALRKNTVSVTPPANATGPVLWSTADCVGYFGALLDPAADTACVDGDKMPVAGEYCVGGNHYGDSLAGTAFALALHRK